MEENRFVTKHCQFIISSYQLWNMLKNMQHFIIVSRFSASVTSVTKDHLYSINASQDKKIPRNTMIYDAIPYKIQDNLTNFTQQFMSSLFIYVVIYLFVCYRYIIYPACLAHSASPRGSRHIPSSANSESKIYFTATHICICILYVYLSRKPRYHDNTLSSAGL